MKQYYNFRFAHFMFFLLSIAPLMVFVLFSPVALLASEALSPGNHMAEGLASFQRGDFEQAVTSWEQAVAFYQQEKRLQEQVEVRIKLSQGYQSLGQYQKALKHLESALVPAEASGDQLLVAAVWGKLGNACIAAGTMEKAQRLLNESLAIARERGANALMAVVLNDTGNLFIAQKKYPEALAAYREAAALAEQTNNVSLAAAALINSATAAFSNGGHEESKALLDNAREKIPALPQSHDKAFSLINIGLGYYELRPHLPAWENQLLLLAFESLNAAGTVAESIDDRRAASYAWGYLGKLYAEEHRYQEALQLTRKASFAAQQMNAPESLYQWQWQTGRLLKTLGDLEAAISAHRRAVDTLQSIRQEMSVTYGKGQQSFRESAGPVYFELVDLLLQRAASFPDPEHYQPYLVEARETVELLKVAELRDYFQDECVDAAQARVTSLDTVSQTAVVVYPILLPDRIELLVSLPSGLKRFSVPVDAATVTAEVRKFRQLLEKRISREYLPHAQKLYEWLFRPLEADLARFPTDTVVFVPDGALRTIPMAALHDGKEFLISKFSLAVTPGLNLTDPQPLRRGNIKVLAMGLTEASQGFPPLPFVASELTALQEIFAGSTLLNQDFLSSRIEHELIDQPFTIVHIASHGQFDHDVNKTFILTFDDKLTMDRLDQCVGFFRFREDPLELLTLSACETAAGDDRAALGLAGIAVKAGARSALATLWHVNDQASSMLVEKFYRELNDPSVSRSVALQRAQLDLIRDPRYEHPGYWSPFLLINNWL